MDNAKYQQMDAFRLQFDDEPDGAFFQLAMDLHNWDAHDWMEFSEEYYKREAAAQPHG